MNQSAKWYQELLKPSWAPPAQVFGPVWTVLYSIIALSYGYIAYQYFSNGLPSMLALPFLLNLVFNFAYSPIQFGLKNLALATVDILLVLATLAWALFAVYSFIPWIAWVNVPYLVWVSFATVLQLVITAMNWGRK